MTRRPNPRDVVVLVAFTALWTCQALASWASAGTRPVNQQATFRVLSVAAGPRGSEAGGRYRLDEVRSRFNRQRDTHVIVFFQWDGTAGRHRLAARWRGPGGDVSTQSEFDYDARDRQFGAYWDLPLSPSTPVGQWSIEATIDGLPSGTLSFEVADDDLASAAVVRRPLEPSQLFERARGVFVEIRRSTPFAGFGDTAAGLVVAPGKIATAFPVIDATDALTITLASGLRLPDTAIAGWDRHEGWAVLITPGPGTAPLPPARETPKVGDRCHSIAGSAGGAHLLIDGSIVGVGAPPAGGTRFIVNFFNGVAIAGAPVLDEYGDVIGMVGWNSVQDAGSLVRRLSQGRAGFGLTTGPVIPISRLLSQGAAAPVSIEELRRRGVLLAPIVGDHVLSGGFSRQINSRPVARPVDQRDEFSAREGGVVFAFLTWDPKARIKGAAVLHLYDQENQSQLESKPKKVDLKPGEMVFGHWQLPLPAVVGSYRVDVTIGEAVVWRGYFRVTP